MRISDWSSDVCSSDLFSDSQNLHIKAPAPDGLGSEYVIGHSPTEKFKAALGVVYSRENQCLNQDVAETSHDDSRHALYDGDVAVFEIARASDNLMAVDKFQEVDYDRQSTRLNSSH